MRSKLDSFHSSYYICAKRDNNHEVMDFSAFKKQSTAEANASIQLKGFVTSGFFSVGCDSKRHIVHVK